MEFVSSLTYNDLQIQILHLECIKFIVSNLETNKEFKLTKQKESEATYSLWRDENDYFINWELPIKKICRFIDALGFPYKVSSA